MFALLTCFLFGHRPDYHSIETPDGSTYIPLHFGRNDTGYNVLPCKRCKVLVCS